MFPTSDRRHPVLTPQALLVGKYLNQCVVSSAHEAALGLLLCGLMTRMAAPAHRVTPEVLVFYRDCLAAFVPPGAAPAAAAANGAAEGGKGGKAEAAGKGAKGGKGKRKAEAPAAAPAAEPAAPSTSSASVAADADADDSFVRFAPGVLQLSGAAAASASAEEGGPAVPQLDMYGVLGTPASDPRFAGDDFKLSLLRVALCGVRRCALLASTPNPTAPGAAAAAKAAAVAAAAAEDGEDDGGSGFGAGGGGGGTAAALPYAGLPCFQQLFEPLMAAVAALKRIERQLPAELQELRQSVHSQLTKTTAACVASRRPLVHPGRARAAAAAAAGAGAVIPAAAVREFNPRFEEDYVSGRDYDPDRQRSEQRRLKRQVTKERRGAIRELRRDAVFMAGERDRERAGVDAERLESERRFYSELQRQEADLKSGGQAGMNPHLKKKKMKK